MINEELNPKILKINDELNKLKNKKDEDIKKCAEEYDGIIGNQKIEYENAIEYDELIDECIDNIKTITDFKEEKYQDLL